MNYKTLSLRNTLLQVLFDWSTISYLDKLKKGKDIKGWADTGNLVRDKFFEFFKYRDTDQVFIQDSSMEPLIPCNSKLNVHLISPIDLREKDVIAFKLDKKITARRFYRFDDIYVLVPENKEHEIIYYKDVLKIDFLGKVTSYTASLS